MAQGLLASSARVTMRLAGSSRSLVRSAASLLSTRTSSIPPKPSCARKSIAAGFTATRNTLLPSNRCVQTAAASSVKEVSFEPAVLPAVAVSSSAAAGWQGDLLVLAVTEEDLATQDEVTTLKSERLQQLDGSLGGVVAEIVAAGGFEGKPGTQSRVVRVGGAGPSPRNLALVGLGKAAKLSVAPEWGQSPFQTLGSTVASLAKTNRFSSAAVALMAVPEGAAAAEQALAQITTGAVLGGYESSRFKSKKSPTASKLAAVHVLLEVEEAAAAAAVERGLAAARGNLLARYLVEAPPNVCTPSHLAAAAAHIASQAPERFELKVYEKSDCEAMGMGCYLGVAEASDEPPKFIHLKYTPKSGEGGGPASRKVAIVGKGLTFDSGGYNLKAGAGSMIELMKFDMGGAAAALGAARILGELQPSDLEVHFIVAACENMISGRGLRPGDILTAASGKTVEVNNTDAEGRLTLADAMWFAQEKCGVQVMVDVATLTGACMVALGGSIAGLFTPSDRMATDITTAARVAGEKVWRLPMEDEYFESLKSPVADMKNTGGRMGGAITAALFLKQFVKEGVEWAHIDVAGPVWNEKVGLPTGYGAALLAEWALAQAAAK